MKAIVYTKYGSPDVLEFKEVEIPAPRENEVLIKTEAASLNAADWHLLRADPFLVRIMGIIKPSRHRVRRLSTLRQTNNWKTILTRG